MGLATITNNILVDSGILTANIPDSAFPSQTGNNGKYLTTDGSVLSWGTVSGGNNIYTADGTLTGDRTVTSNGNILKILGGKSDISGFPLHQIALRLEGATTSNEIYLNLKNTNANGKEYALRSMTDSTFEIFNYTNSSLVFKHQWSTNIFSFRTLSYLTNDNFTIGRADGLNGLWFNTTRTTATYNLCQSGSDTFLNAPTGGKIGFRVANSDRMTLTNAGRLLIGTTTESTFLLDVNGTARINGSTTFGTLGTNTGMFWDNTNNNLGIGTNTPSFKLDVLGNISNSVVGIKVRNASTSGYSEINCYNNGNTVNDRMYMGVGGTATGDAFQNRGYFFSGANLEGITFTTNKSTADIRFNTTGSTERMRLTSEGRLLLGTTTENNSALLNVTSTSQGFLPPRMTNTQRAAIATPAAGLIVYSTDTTEGAFVNTSLGWQRIATLPITTTTASTATLTPNIDAADTFTITAQAAALSVANPTGTPVNGQKMTIRIKDNGTARAITWSGTQYRASTDLALPTTTIATKTMYLGFIYNSTDTKWDLIAFINNF